MYIPGANEESRIPVLHALMAARPFATLVTMGASGLFASHIPMVLQQEGAALGRLKGHLSRANTQWRDFSPEVEALAIFAGDHHYISPSWYAEKQQSGKVVPTWNYVVVHAYGRLTVIHDSGWLREHVASLTTIHEAQFAAPWKVSDAPEEYIQTMAKGIVGLEFAITRLEGKWKLGQNRSESDRLGVCHGLEELHTPESQAMQALVQKTIDETKKKD